MDQYIHPEDGGKNFLRNILANAIRGVNPRSSSSVDCRFQIKDSVPWTNYCWVLQLVIK